MNYLLSTKMVYLIESAKPKVPAEHYVILTEIAQGIMKLFNTNNSFQLVAESQYLLERFIETDIPEALQNYYEFPKNQDNSKEIEDALFSQLKLIRDRVDSHEEEIQANILKEMKSRSSYLRMGSLYEDRGLDRNPLDETEKPFFAPDDTETLIFNPQTNQTTSGGVLD